jgi:hypothetical protein
VLIPPIYFTGYVGPFAAYPHAAYCLIVATSLTKTDLPRWRNAISTQALDTPDDAALAVLHQHVMEVGRLILLFTPPSRRGRSSCRR